MKRFELIVLVICTLLLLLSQSASGQPTFQVYIELSTPGDYGPDQQTWFTTEPSFTLRVVGAYKDGTTDLREVTILASVPEGETGTIEISDATLLHTAPLVPGPSGYYNPKTDADEDLLTNEAGNLAGYDGYDTKNFLPDDITFNNHYPLQDSVSDFVIYGIGDFDDLYLVHNYNADTTDPDFVDPLDPGFPPLTGHLGEEKTFAVTVSGFSSVHFDAYGYMVVDENNRSLVATWDISPGSHDATYIPAPGAVFLAGIGVGLVTWLRRRKTL